jgi:HSP20 family protein
MRLRELVPARQRNDLARPEVLLFGPLHREIDRLFDEFTRGLAPLGTTANLVPNIDVSESDKQIEVSVEMPGLERGDVDISLEDNVLTIRGEKKIEADRSDKNVQVSERAFGVFYRAIELPPGVDPASVNATMCNGVLKITIPKPANAEARKIEVKEAKDGATSARGRTQ